MPYLMTDAAQGGNATLQLMQNMGAAPYATQAGAAMEQEPMVKLQQEQAALEKSRLVNLAAAADYRMEKDVAAKVQGYLSSPEGQRASDTERLSNLAKFEFEAGRIEEGSKLLQAEGTVAVKEATAKARELDNTARELYKANSAVEKATPEELKTILDKMPDAQKEAIKAAIPGFFEESNPELQKAQLKGLMETAAGQNAAAVNANRLAIQEMRDQTNILIKAMQEAGLDARKAAGVGGKYTDADKKAYDTYLRIDRQIDTKYKQEIKDATDTWKAAVRADAPNRLQRAFGYTPSTESSDKAWKDLQAIQKKMYEEKLDKLELMPEGDEKDRLIEFTLAQLASVQEGKDPGDVKAPKPTASTEPTATSSGGGGTMDRPDASSSDRGGPESGNDYSAVNPTSGAMGRYQILPSVYEDLRKQNPNLPKTKGEFLDSPEAQDEAMRMLEERNRAALKKAGYPDSRKNLATYHRFGAGDGKKVLDAFENNPNTPLKTALGDDRYDFIVKSNPDLKDITVSQAIAKNFGNYPKTSSTAPAASTTPAATVKAPTTEAEFNKQWQALQPGEHIVGLDGKTYTKPGKPAVTSSTAPTPASTATASAVPSSRMDKTAQKKAADLAAARRKEEDRLADLEAEYQKKLIDQAMEARKRMRKEAEARKLAGLDKVDSLLEAAH